MAGAAALAAAAAPQLVACGGSQARGRERVAIVGAGIAGLVTAMRLRDAGIDSTVYESSARVGGRMHSERSYWDAGQHTEWCGAMVDSLHLTMHRLARRFNLALLDTHAAWPAGARDTCYLDGRYYAMSDADRDFAKIYPILQEQLGKVDPATTYANATPTARRLDLMSMRDWIERYVPNGLESQLGRLIAESYRNEYGREIEELSALNLVLQLGVQRSYAQNHQMNVLGYSDQRYILSAGSQALPEAIAGWLPAGSVLLNHRLLAIRRIPGGSYELRFDHSGTSETVYADRVVLDASVHRVARARLFERGLRFGEGQCDREPRLWLSHQAAPAVRPARLDASDAPVAGTHERTDMDDISDAELARLLTRSTRPARPHRSFHRREPGDARHPPMPYARIADSAAVARHVRRCFEQLDRIWPGVSPTWNGKATFGNAQADPNILASYSCWLVGQCTTIAGHEARVQGRVHFAGEHTSVAYQGFMEGGAESGFRAADEILREHGVRTKLTAA